MANPLVAGALGLQFYAGFPLTTHDGHRLGTLCVIDRKPRATEATELETLQTLAAVVMDELELRLSARRVVELEQERLRRSRVAAARSERRAQTLQAGLESNREIGKALGLTMAHYGLSDEAALEKLKGHSQDLNIKLNQLAAQIIAHHNSAEDRPAGARRVF